MKYFYLLSAVIGAIVPWVCFGHFFAINGFSIMQFISGLFANGAASGFALDVLISIVVFWVWVFIDAKRLNISTWWWVLPASCCVGLSLALPLYLYMREDFKEKNPNSYI